MQNLNRVIRDILTFPAISPALLLTLPQLIHVATNGEDVITQRDVLCSLSNRGMDGLEDLPVTISKLSTGRQSARTC